jgi:hypothetical protein
MDSLLIDQMRFLDIQKQEQSARHWWLTPIILATWEAEIRRIGVRSQPQANSLLRSYLANTQWLRMYTHTHTHTHTQPALVGFPPVPNTHPQPGPNLVLFLSAARHSGPRKILLPRWGRERSFIPLDSGVPGLWCPEDSAKGVGHTLEGHHRSLGTTEFREEAHS